MKIKTLLPLLVLFATGIRSDDADAQTSRKKIRLSLSSTTVTLLPTFAAYDKGFFRDEGFDVELIQMPATLASTALMTGDLDYNGAATGVISAAVQGRPMKCLVFTVSRPLMFLVSRKDIREPRDLKGKKVAGSTPGASATLFGTTSVRAEALEAGIGACFLHFGFDMTVAAVIDAFEPEIAAARERSLDFKSALQERLARRGALVEYATVAELGPAHARTFEVVARVAGEEVGRGSGPTKKDAEQAAAAAALEAATR